MVRIGNGSGSGEWERQRQQEQEQERERERGRCKRTGHGEQGRDKQTSTRRVPDRDEQTSDERCRLEEEELIDLIGYRRLHEEKKQHTASERPPYIHCP